MATSRDIFPLIFFLAPFSSFPSSSTAFSDSLFFPYPFCLLFFSPLSWLSWFPLIFILISRSLNYSLRFAIPPFSLYSFLFSSSVHFPHFPSILSYSLHLLFALPPFSFNSFLFSSSVSSFLILFHDRSVDGSKLRRWISLFFFSLLSFPDRPVGGETVNKSQCPPTPALKLWVSQ